MHNISSEIIKTLPFKGIFALTKIGPVRSVSVDRLDSQEIEELNSFTNEKRKQEYVASRLLLKDMAEQQGIKAESFCIEKDELGQPYAAASGEKYFVSIAHTTEQVFCGLTKEAAIGIDLEPVNRKVPSRLKRRIMHPDENEGVSGIEAIRLWTIKEAYIKLQGQGLRLNMNQVLVEGNEGDFFVQINDDKRAKICSFRSHNNWLALAYYL